MAQAQIPENLIVPRTGLAPQRFVPANDLTESSDYHVALTTRAAETLALGHRHWLANVSKKTVGSSFTEFISTLLVDYFTKAVFVRSTSLITSKEPDDATTFVKNGSFFTQLMEKKEPTVWVDPARDELNEAYLKLMEIDLNVMSEVALFHANNVRFPRTFPVGKNATMKYVPAQLTGTPMVAVSSRTYKIPEKQRDAENATFIPVLLRNVIPYAPTALSAILYRLRYNRFLSIWNAANPVKDEYAERQLFTPNMIVLVVVKPNPESDSNLVSLALFSPEHNQTSGLENELYLLDLQGPLDANKNFFIGKFHTPTVVDAYVARVLAAKGVNDTATTRVHFAAYVYENELASNIFPRFDTLVANLSQNMGDMYGGVANIQNKVEFYGFPEYAEAHPSKKPGSSSARVRTLADLDDDA